MKKIISIFIFFFFFLYIININANIITNQKFLIIPVEFKDIENEIEITLLNDLFNKVSEEENKNYSIKTYLESIYNNETQFTFDIGDKYIPKMDSISYGLDTNNYYNQTDFFHHFISSYKYKEEKILKYFNNNNYTSFIFIHNKTNNENDIFNSHTYKLKSNDYNVNKLGYISFINLKDINNNKLLVNNILDLLINKETKKTPELFNPLIDFHINKNKFEIINLTSVSKEYNKSNLILNFNNNFDINQEYYLLYCIKDNILFNLLESEENLDYDFILYHIDNEKISLIDKYRINDSFNFDILKYNNKLELPFELTINTLKKVTFKNYYKDNKITSNYNDISINYNEEIDYNNLILKINDNEISNYDILGEYDKKKPGTYKLGFKVNYNNEYYFHYFNLEVKNTTPITNYKMLVTIFSSIIIFTISISIITILKRRNKTNSDI